MGELSANTVSRRTNELTGKPRSPVPLTNGTSFNFDLQLSLDTSFGGKDLLRTVLRAGNFADSVFGGEPHALGLSQLEIAFQEECVSADCGNLLAVDKLFTNYRFAQAFRHSGPSVRPRRYVGSLAVKRLAFRHNPEGLYRQRSPSRV